LSPIDLVVALILIAGFLVNRVPAIPVAAIAIVSMRGLAGRFAEGVKFKKLELAICLFLAYWLVNYSWSTGSFDNLISFEFLRNDGAPLVTYPTFALLLGWYLKPKSCQALWLAFLVALTMIAIPGMMICLRVPMPYLVQRLGLAGPDQFGKPVFTGWFEAHNTTGGMYALGSIIVLAFLEEVKLGYKTRICTWFLLLCCLGGLAFTYSRSSYVAFVAGAAFILPLRKLNKMAKIGFGMGLPVAFLVLTVPTLRERVASIVDPSEGTNASRLDSVWKEGLEDFALSPLVGIGFGRFNDDLRQFAGVKNVVYVATKGIIINGSDHAHNSYLHFAAEGGIVGLFVAMYLWWCAWEELSAVERKMPRSKLHWLMRASRACILGIAVISISNIAWGGARWCWL